MVGGSEGGSNDLEPRLDEEPHMVTPDPLFTPLHLFELKVIQI